MILGQMADILAAEELIATTITPAGTILDPGAGFLVWFSQETGAPHGAAGMRNGGLEKQSPFGSRLAVPETIAQRVFAGWA